MLREICGEWTIVPMGERLMEFNGMMRLNETGAFIWKCMEQETTAGQVAEKLFAEYNLSSREQAQEEVEAFVANLRKEGLVED